MVLNQLQELNMSQNAHHVYCTTSLKTWMIRFTMFITSSPTSTKGTTPGMSEGIVGHALHVGTAFVCMFVCF